MLFFALAVLCWLLFQTADYNNSINHLTEEYRTNKIDQQVYNKDLATCNHWFRVGEITAGITLIFTFLGWNRLVALHSKIGYQIANAFVGVFLGHTLSDVMWINDMVTLINGDVSWF